MSRRSSAFFNSDVASAAEDMAYRLGDDYELGEDATATLSEAIEAAVHAIWLSLRESTEAGS